MNKKFTFQFRVYYEDTDAQGVVYNANYLRFMGRTRTEWLRNLDFEESYLSGIDNFFVVRRVEIDYLKPIKLNDIIEVSLEVEKVGGCSLTVRQNISSAKDNSIVYAKSLVTIVNVNGKLKPKRLDEKFRSKI